MTWSPLHLAWLLLAILAYLMVYAMLRVLSENFYHQIRLHNRICEARNIRREYLDDMSRR